MRIALTRSILAPLARCSKSTVASSSRIRIDSAAAEHRLVSSASWNRVRVDDGRAAIPRRYGAEVQCRSLTSSITRHAGEKAAQQNLRQSGSAESQRSGIDNQESIASSQTSTHPRDASQAESPSTSSSSSETPQQPEEAVTQSSASDSTPTTPPPSPPPLEHPPRSSPSHSSPSSSSVILERFRKLTSQLPQFDRLKATSSLSTLLSTASTKAQHLRTQLGSKLSHLSSQYNTYSGYTAIEDLKLRITSLEASLDSARALAVTAKKTYLTAVQNRSASQRETNDLLSRKNSWSEADLGRYTELLRKEHGLSRQEAEAEKELERSEAEVQGAFDELMKAVLVRYHEEQIWSDRMRGWSTYGSLVVAGLNAFLFILAILLVEPYKRKKLAQTFESRLVAAEEESRKLILSSVEQFQLSLNAALIPATPEPILNSEPVTPPPSTPQQMQPAQEEPEANDPVASPTIIESKSDEAAALRHKQEEERLVFASTVGVVVGAVLSLLIGACWS
ncbi:related to SHE9 - mitochondrial inner membrane protein [Ustilago trichophora]|uniref:Sensitive to high expression protein 9, mitochondrial n=1 Tax=Ustilago trichophora TaxID=86804 RepID=A0A5C3EDW2_9BASI|nr:related to SHE9 - mitochondrial inner membrane protein [Ustilago trichophora]